MSLLVKIGDTTSSVRGVVYLDAVTSYERSYSGKVSSHPLESGVAVSDHFSGDNPKFSISGIISGVDLSAIPSLLFVDGEPVMNYNLTPSPVEISNLNASWRRYLPDSIDQFIPNTLPVAIVDPRARQDFKEEIEALFERVIDSVYFNESRKRWENRMTLITLIETEGSKLGRSTGNLVLTSCRVSEDPETGESLKLDLSFERVRFATVEMAEAPKPIKGSSASKQAAETKDKGSVTAEQKKAIESPNDHAYAMEVLEGK